MALNWAALNENHSPIPLPHEHTIVSVDSGVIVHLDVPDVPPSGASMSGGSGGTKKLKANGSVSVTDQRVRFTRFSFMDTDQWM